MQTVLRAAFAYFWTVFTVGFVLGTVRVLAVAPYLGTTLAVMIESPLMLIVSWFACRWIIGRFSVLHLTSHRLAMGGLAFCLLLIAEFGVSRFGFGRSLAEHVATYRTASAAFGLLAQLAFALFPILQARRSVPWSHGEASC